MAKMSWIQALKLFNSTREIHLIPKTGTCEYNAVKEIMETGVNPITVPKPKKGKGKK